MLAEAMKVRPVELQRFAIHANAVLADYPMLASNLEVVEWRNVLLDRMVMQLRTWALAGKENGYFEVPDTWWDHLKEEWFPDWLLERFPAKYRRLEYVTHYVCPHATEKWPDRQHIRFMEYGPDER